MYTEEEPNKQVKMGRLKYLSLYFDDVQWCLVVSGGVIEPGPKTNGLGILILFGGGTQVIGIGPRELIVMN